MNYYEKHIGDYLRDTAHLSLLEHGIYNRLLDVYYTREGKLPIDVARLIGARTRDEKSSLSAVLDEFFEHQSDGWGHKRCAAEIARFQDKQAKAKRSADARWSALRTHSGGNANAFNSGDAHGMRTHTEGNANDMRSSCDGDAEAMQRARPSPDSSLQSLIHSEPNGSGGKPPLPPDEIIFGYGVPLLVSAGATDKSARSFLGGLSKGHGKDALVDAIRDCLKAKPLQPLEWLAAALPPKGSTRNGNHDTEPGWVRERRERMQQAAPYAAVRSTGKDSKTVDMEAENALARIPR